MEKIEETKAWKIILKVEEFIIILMSLLLMLTVVLGVSLRYLFRVDLYGIEEFLVIFALWLYFVGATYGSYKKSHISAEIVVVFLKNQKLVKLFNILRLFISTLTAAVFTFWGFNYTLWGLQKMARSIGWRIPLIISQIPIFIGLLLMCMYFFVRLVKLIKNTN
jgi:TRAP-type C4-dicarboxylate transport system permease small subunit